MKRHLPRLSIPSLSIFALGSFAAPAWASNGYDVTPLPATDDGPFYAHQVMPNGYVVGTGGNTARASVWTPAEGMVSLSYVDPNTMMETPLSGLGVPIGMTVDRRRVALGGSKWVWDEGVLGEVPFLEMGSNFSPQVNAMNVGGLVVGHGDVPWALSTAFVWDGEAVTVIGPMDQVATATAISTGGTIAGTVHDANDNPVPYVFQGGNGPGSLGLPDGYLNGTVAGVNDGGVLVGAVSSGSESVGWAYIDGEHRVYPELDCVLSVNAAGHMLGQQGLGCGLAWGHPPFYSVDGGETWNAVAPVLEGESPFSPQDQLQGVGIDDAGRMVINAKTLDFVETALVLTPEGSGDLALIVEVPAAVQGGPFFDYDVTLDNVGIIDVISYDTTITFSGDAKLTQGAIPDECTATKDADQWVSLIECEGQGPVGAESSHLRRYGMVPSQLGTVTANVQITANLADGTQELLVEAVDTVVSDDSADLSVEVSTSEQGEVVTFTVVNAGPDAAKKPRLALTTFGGGFEPLTGEVADECVLAEDSRVLRCTITSLGAGETWKRTTTQVLIEPEEARIDAEVESDTPDPDPSNNSFSFEPGTEPPHPGCGGGNCSTTGGAGSAWLALLALFGLRRRHVGRRARR